MFKFATLIRADGVTINPFICPQLCSYVRNEVIITTYDIYEIIKHSMSKLEKPIVIIIGDESKDETLRFSSIQDCIKFLSEHRGNCGWWVIGDNYLANDMIHKGLIMDVHIVKSYAKPDTKEWELSESNILKQKILFDKSLLVRRDMQFELISTTRDSGKNYTKTQHYLRRNVEENRLLATMSDIINNGDKRINRTGVNTRSIFGKQFEYEMVERVDENGKSSFRIPILTTKKMFLRGVFAELIWFLRGSTNSKELEAQGVNIWKGNSSREYLDSVGLHSYEDGQCGPIYGFQMRHSGANWSLSQSDYSNQGVDQITNVIESLKKDPFSRRHIISLWAPNQLNQMCLPPCHILYQFYVQEQDGQMLLSLMMTQRSADVLLGVPFNICSCSILLAIMAHHVGMKPYRFIHNVADAHIYETHIDASLKQTQRDPFMFPFLSIESPVRNTIQDYEFTDIKIHDYHHHNTIKADMVA